MIQPAVDDDEPTYEYKIKNAKFCDTKYLGSNRGISCITATKEFVYFARGRHVFRYNKRESLGICNLNNSNSSRSYYSLDFIPIKLIATKRGNLILCGGYSTSHLNFSTRQNRFINIRQFEHGRVIDVLNNETEGFFHEKFDLQEKEEEDETNFESITLLTSRGYVYKCDVPMRCLNVSNEMVSITETKIFNNLEARRDNFYDGRILSPQCFIVSNAFGQTLVVLDNLVLQVRNHRGSIYGIDAKLCKQKEHDLIFISTVGDDRSACLWAIVKSNIANKVTVFFIARILDVTKGRGWGTKLKYTEMNDTLICYTCGEDTRITKIRLRSILEHKSKWISVDPKTDTGTYHLPWDTQTFEKNGISVSAFVTGYANNTRTMCLETSLYVGCSNGAVFEYDDCDEDDKKQPTNNNHIMCIHAKGWPRTIDILSKDLYLVSYHNEILIYEEQTGDIVQSIPWNGPLFYKSAKVIVKDIVVGVVFATPQGELFLVLDPSFNDAVVKSVKFNILPLTTATEQLLRPIETFSIVSSRNTNFLEIIAQYSVGFESITYFFRIDLNEWKVVNLSSLRVKTPKSVETKRIKQKHSKFNCSQGIELQTRCLSINDSSIAEVNNLFKDFIFFTGGDNGTVIFSLYRLTQNFVLTCSSSYELMPVLHRGRKINSMFLSQTNNDNVTLYTTGYDSRIYKTTLNLNTKRITNDNVEIYSHSSNLCLTNVPKENPFTDFITNDEAEKHTESAAWILFLKPNYRKDYGFNVLAWSEKLIYVQYGPDKMDWLRVNGIESNNTLYGGIMRKPWDMLDSKMLFCSNQSLNNNASITPILHINNEIFFTPIKSKITKYDGLPVNQEIYSGGILEKRHSTSFIGYYCDTVGNAALIRIENNKQDHYSSSMNVLSRINVGQSLRCSAKVFLPISNCFALIFTGGKSTLLICLVLNDKLEIIHMEENETDNQDVRTMSIHASSMSSFILEGSNYDDRGNDCIKVITADSMGILHARQYSVSKHKNECRLLSHTKLVIESSGTPIVIDPIINFRSDEEKNNSSTKKKLQYHSIGMSNGDIFIIKELLKDVVSIQICRKISVLYNKIRGVNGLQIYMKDNDINTLLAFVCSEDGCLKILSNDEEIVHELKLSNNSLRNMKYLHKSKQLILQDWNASLFVVNIAHIIESFTRKNNDVQNKDYWLRKNDGNPKELFDIKELKKIGSTDALSLDVFEEKQLHETFIVFSTGSLSEMNIVKVSTK